MRFVHASLLVAVATLAPGCIAAAVVAGAAAAYGYVQYDENEAYRDYRADVDTTFDAVAAALRRQGHTVREGVTFSDVRGELRVDDVKVRVTANSSLSSRVTVRVGTFRTDDHRARAAAILEDIAARLGE